MRPRRPRILQQNPALKQLAPKLSHSQERPFRRLLVKIKREIIAFGQPGIDPARQTAPRVSPNELCQWLDEGRPIVLLDTRNDYEYAMGTFANAVTMDLQKFRDFPQAVDQIPEHLKAATVVSFCTGGIHCEKASPYLQQRGFQNVYQLDGGILKYFELVGARHYDGDCFVFDGRVGLDPGLQETDSTQCFACQAVLRPEDVQDSRYQKGRSCPHCYQSPQNILAKRAALLAELTQTLPGSKPGLNRRPIRLPGHLDGQTWEVALNRLFPHLPSQEWQDLLAAHCLQDDKGQSADLNKVARAGQQLIRLTPDETEPEVATDISFLYEDESILILSKPAPLPMHPCGRYHRNTLRNLLNMVYAPDSPRPAHRLDANTTGLVVCSRTHRYAKSLQDQFANRQVEKIYLALVQGQPDDHFQVDCPISTQVLAAGRRTLDSGLPLEGDGRGGHTPLPSEGQSQQALTIFKTLERRNDGTCVVECRPITGRTNQIRLHLARAGYPIVGDHSYSQETDLLAPLTSQSRLYLHAWRLEFAHPRTGQRLKFEAPCDFYVPEQTNLQLV